MQTRRRYPSNHEIDEFVEAQQFARARERSESAEWGLVDPEDGLPGLVLRETKLRSLSSGLSGGPMITTTHTATVNSLAYPFAWLGLMEHRAECSCSYRGRWHIDKRQADRDASEHAS